MTVFGDSSKLSKMLLVKISKSFQATVEWEHFRNSCYTGKDEERIELADQIELGLDCSTCSGLASEAERLILKL